MILAFFVSIRAAQYAIAGVVFRAYSVRTLGAAFTFDVATLPEQSVCERGPYRYIRHPAYAGSLMTIFGAAIALGNAAAVALVTLCAVFIYGYRISIEERVLRRDLGAPYVAYIERTRRLVPFLF